MIWQHQIQGHILIVRLACDQLPDGSSSVRMYDRDPSRTIWCMRTNLSAAARFSFHLAIASSGYARHGSDSPRCSHIEASQLCDFSRRRHGLFRPRLLRRRNIDSQPRRASRSRHTLYAVSQHSPLLADPGGAASRVTTHNRLISMHFPTLKIAIRVGGPLGHTSSPNICVSKGTAIITRASGISTAVP